ncbi:MAG: GHKL domain-containing protein [Desulfobacteraceae bacterium]|nr:MAG: GHKL domain-containing protein [Desulfobacteraceae bacterium]
MLETQFTQYAPARRSDLSTIELQKKMLAEYSGSLRQLYDAVSEIVLIVNQDRQIVFFNSAVPALLGIDDPETIYGMRPGEALGCRCSCTSPSGCGTTSFCSQCGAVNAILAALSNKADLQECRLLKKDNVEAFDLLVRTTPLAIQGQLFIIVAITDISHEKRRRALERIFFHDIMNTAASIRLIANMLQDGTDEKDAAAFKQNLLAGAKQLVEELCSQKELLAAENNELTVRMHPIDGIILMKDVVEVFSNRFRSHRIVMAAPDGKMVLNTDSTLLRRVLGNMILNALEASQPQEAVRVSCGIKDGWAEFRVHNESHIPQEVQLRLFQRSFSTKGPGHGLGTYSMKLLSERYLNGRIDLTSTPQNGTTFVARLPAISPEL